MSEGKANPGPDTSGRRGVLRALAESSTYRDYAEAFSRTTGLPVSLTPVDTCRLAHQGHARESPFCALLSQHGPACAACLRTQHTLVTTGAQSAHTVECAHGLCETAVPVRTGTNLFGFVRTGQVFRRPPTAAGFQRVLGRLRAWGVTIDVAGVREAYFATRVLEPAQYRSMVGLLDLLARHLSLRSNDLLLQQGCAEPPPITRAKEFIEANYGDRLSLRQVAQVARVSPYLFCKQFKQATGLTFTRYVTRLRVEKAKNLLLNPHYRVSEVGYAVGFGSLTHFDRRFREVTGFSPTDYRAQLGAWRDRLADGRRARSDRSRPPSGSRTARSFINPML
jgi:AraC-like DNA-binding protein